MHWPEHLQLEPLMEASFEIDKDILDVGTSAFGSRRILRARNGKCRFVSGNLSGIEGTVLEGSADYALYSRDEELVQIDVRSVIEIKLENSGKGYLYVNYTNDVELSQDLRNELKRPGGQLGFDRSNFIVQPRIEVGTPRGKEGSAILRSLSRLVHTRIVAHAQLSPLKIEYRMYEIVNRTAKRGNSG